MKKIPVRFQNEKREWLIARTRQGGPPNCDPEDPKLNKYWKVNFFEKTTRYDVALLNPDILNAGQFQELHATW